MYQLAPGQQLYISPTDDTVTAFTRLLASAKQSIYVADYSFNLPGVTATLIKQHRAGLDVRLVLDDSQASGRSEAPLVASLQAAGVPLVLVDSGQGGIMHDKFSVIDGVAVQFGSWNYTTAAARENNFYFVWNDLLTPTNINLASRFSTTFMDMWNGKTTRIKYRSTGAESMRKTEMNDLVTSFIRTAVPYLVSTAVTLLATRNVHISDVQQAQAIAFITFAAGSAYYYVVRALETKLPKLGYLLGVPTKPTYSSK